MARNGSGTMVVTDGTYSGTNTFTQERDNSPGTITVAHFDAYATDMAAEITNSWPRDGQAAPTADMPMGGFKLTGVGDGAATTQYASVLQVQGDTIVYAGATGGTGSAYTLTPTIPVPAYLDGARFRCKLAATNNLNPTLAVSGLAAKSVQTLDSTQSLLAGTLLSGTFCEFVYKASSDKFIVTNYSPGLLTYVPTYSGNTSAQTAVAAKYEVLGSKIVHVSLVVTLTVTAGQTSITISLPFTTPNYSGASHGGWFANVQGGNGVANIGDNSTNLTFSLISGATLATSAASTFSACGIYEVA